MEENPNQPNAPANSYPAQAPIAPVSPPVRSNKKFPLKIILGVILVFLVFGSAAGFYIYSKSSTNQQKACTMEAKLCPDGSSVGRTGPNCEFAPCPTPKPTTMEKVGKFYWSTTMQSGIDVITENEIKEAFANYSPKLYGYEAIQITHVNTSTQSANYVITTAAYLDKNLAVVPSEPFEYLLEKAGGNWIITGSSSEHICDVLKRLPNDLVGSRREYYIGCFKN